MTTATDWTEEIDRRLGDLVALRRDFHRHPELSFEERRTAGIIAERLSAAKVDVRTGIAGTGMVGVLRGDRPGRTTRRGLPGSGRPPGPGAGPPGPGQWPLPGSCQVTVGPPPEQ